MTSQLLPRKVITPHGKQNGGSRKYQGLKMEPEFMSGEDFLRMVEARLARMEEMASAFHDYQTDNFRRELEEKQLRASIAKTTACGNISQNSGITENDEITKLLKIYDPDREAELADVFRYREYSEELETIEELDSIYVDDNENACGQDFAPKCKNKAEYLYWLRHKVLNKEDIDKEYDDQVESNQGLAVEFKNGTEYLQWLKFQLPNVEPFQQQDETHYYFFRKWRKDDPKYFSEMERLVEMENEDNEEETETSNSGLIISSLEPIDDETKPEFVSGRQLVEWLGRRLPYVEPFAPNDAVHYFFKRTWSRDTFVARLEELETMEESVKEHVHTAPHIEPNHSFTDDEEDINVYISLLSRPMVFEGFKLQEETQQPHHDEHLPVQVNEHRVIDRKVKDKSLAKALLEPMKTGNEPLEEKKAESHQKKRRNFLSRLFGL